MSSAAILLCAGRGTRMKAAADDKVLAPLLDKPVFLYSFEAFVESGLFSTFVIVFRSLAQRRALEKGIRKFSLPPTLRLIWTRGGVERQDSVASALEALPPTVEWVFIHDGARPMIKATQLRRLAAMARKHGSAVLAHRCIDTLKELPDAADPLGPLPLRTIDRGRLWAMETPQVFRRKEIAAAYADVQAQKTVRVTDDAAAMERAGHPVFIYENTEPNPKLTTPRDLAYALFLVTPPPVKRGRGRPPGTTHVDKEPLP